MKWNLKMIGIWKSSSSMSVQIPVRYAGAFSFLTPCSARIPWWNWFACPMRNAKMTLGHCDILQYSMQRKFGFSPPCCLPNLLSRWLAASFLIVGCASSKKSWATCTKLDIGSLLLIIWMISFNHRYPETKTWMQLKFLRPKQTNSCLNPSLTH